MKINFVVPGEPQGKARQRVTRNGTYTPKKTRDYEALVRKCYQYAANGQQFGEQPVCVIIRANYGVPKSASTKKKNAMLLGEIPPTKKPDADNIAKAICDALNGVAWRDDSQVISLIVRKRYDTIPRVEVYIGGFAEDE